MVEEKHAWHYFDAFGKFIVGVDLAQSSDFTAIVVIERITEHFKKAFDGQTPDRTARHFHVREALRLRQGLPYPEVAAIVGNIVKTTTLKARTGPVEPSLVVDSTGVGRPVVEMMRGYGLKPISVTITSGMNENRAAHMEYTVPKLTLVSNLVVALHEGRLKIAEGVAFGPELINELIHFKVKLSQGGREIFGAERDSIHDDIVMAAAIAVWWGDQKSGGSVRRLWI